MTGQQETVKCWYARRDGVIRGPFTAAVITRYILLGRIKLEDELSEDQLSWQTAMTLTSMLPDEIWQLSSWGGYQRLVLARMQVDERKQDRRDSAAGGENYSGADRRSGKDRRIHIEDVSLSLAQFSFTESEPNKPVEKSPRRLRVLVLTVVLAVCVMAWLVPAVR